MTKDNKTMTQSKEKIKIFNLNSEIEDLKKKIEFLYFKLDTKDKVIQSLEEKLNLAIPEVLFKKEQEQREKHKKQMNDFHNEFQSLLDHALRPEVMKPLKEINDEKNKS
jgi:hypothetical protein